jgi:para-aminobenzoate synthetase/4-amino-4-deoxychorismate lyase
VPVPGWGGHAAAVAACRARIHAGDLFQANVCVRLGASLDGDPIDLFCAGAAALRPARAALVGGPWGTVASLSPELFLTRRGRTVRSAPIKGTRPRPADPEAAARERAALAASEKDRAENVMIVDLVRNDLGRVCEPGSVRVASLCDVQPHTGVWHLVSEVEGTAAAGVGDADVVRAAFPPGSVTGAPKVAALDVIAELESTAREAYTGALGFASPLAGLELNVAIRTFESDGHALWLGVGGGVVADSDPAAEAAECETKAAPLLAAIGARMAPPRAPSPRVAPPPRLGPRPTPRPDPAAGVFETVLVAGGRAVAAERHLARLAASVRALYGAPLPADAADRLHAAAIAAGGDARVRVVAVPAARGVELAVETAALPAAGPAALRACTVPGGLGPHKWRDRRLLDALAAASDGAVPLLVDLDGLVLEAARAHVIVVEGDRALTPPADGRILPGVTRGRLLDAGLVEEAPVALADLERADAVLLTGALRGVEPAAALDGRPLAASPGAVARLTAALRPADGPRQRRAAAR